MNIQQSFGCARIPLAGLECARLIPWLPVTQVQEHVVACQLVVDRQRNKAQSDWPLNLTNRTYHVLTMRGSTPARWRCQLRQHGHCNDPLDFPLWQCAELVLVNQTSEAIGDDFLPVDDMTCGHCVSSITKAVKAVDPGALVRIDLAAQRVDIEPTEADAAELGERSRMAGYTPIAIDSPAGPTVQAAAPGRKGCCCG